MAMLAAYGEYNCLECTPNEQWVYFLGYITGAVGLWFTFFGKEVPIGIWVPRFGVVFKWRNAVRPYCGWRKTSMTKGKIIDPLEDYILHRYGRVSSLWCV